MRAKFIKQTQKKHRTKCLHFIELFQWNGTNIMQQKNYGNYYQLKDLERRFVDVYWSPMIGIIQLEYTII